MPQYLNGAMSIFIMDGAPVDNKRVTRTPLTINLPDGKKIYSTHVCNIIIPGHPTVLTGHIVPLLTIVSLIGIWPLCKTGCTVTFDNEKCDVKFNRKTILMGFKDPTTLTLLIPTNGMVGTTQPPMAANPIIAHKLFSCQVRRALAPATAMTPGPLFPSVVTENSFAAPMVPKSGPCMDLAPLPTIIPTVAIAAFTHSVQTRSNAIKFAHQSLGSPKISSLLKATQKGFFNGCPNITVKLITKYLNPSPGTAKGHMMQPRNGIKSTHPKQSFPAIPLVPNLPPMPQPYMGMPSVSARPQELPAYLGHPGGNTASPNLIRDKEDDELIANMFCFSAFADRNSSIVYHDLTGSFPFML